MKTKPAPVPSVPFLSPSDAVRFRRAFTTRGPLRRVKRFGDAKLFREDGEISWQYQDCMIGTSTGRARTFLLVRKEDRHPVGFMGLELHLEPLGATCNAWVHIPFVYIRPDFRDRGLSHLFVRLAIRRANRWLPKVRSRVRPDQQLVCRIGAAIKSEGGRAFVRALRGKLRRACRELQIEFR